MVLTAAFGGQAHVTAGLSSDAVAMYAERSGELIA
jgi:hypothetical protein